MELVPDDDKSADHARVALKASLSALYNDIDEENFRPDSIDLKIVPFSSTDTYVEIPIPPDKVCPACTSREQPKSSTISSGIAPPRRQRHLGAESSVHGQGV
ncbi:hypothetical protein WG66_008781 [Moniliophthora roreri]|nr:hypothetical protein WG66_008781 [Moniliophthora roreri]